jgi:hypothetical protein
MPIMIRIHRSGLCVAVVCCVNPLFGGEKTSSIVAAPSGVTAVLKAEAQTGAEGTDRRAALETVRTTQESPQARWQSGFVRLGDTWLPFEETQPENADAWREYQVRRSAALKTAAEQVKLADWCREAGLNDQERVHLILALETGRASSPEVILRRLGYRPVGLRWYTDAELKAGAEELKKLGKEWKRLAPRLEMLASQLEGKPARRQKALQELKSLTNRDTIPVLEFVLAAYSEPAATAVVEVLAGIDSWRASQSLARLAIGSPWDSVRESATESLKERPWEEFVPMALEMMTMPLKLTVQTATYSSSDSVRDRLIWHFLWSREGKTAVQLASAVLIDDRYATTRDRSIGLPERIRERGLRIAMESRFVADFVYRQLSTAEEFEDRAVQLNGSIGDMLTAVTSQKWGNDPVSWWNWWDQSVTDAIPGPKATYIVSEDVQSVGVPRYYPTSCLAAGTPVWTETGLRPIEKIQVGDRVLAKNIETGELRFAPVLGTTRRENAALTNLHVADETIVASPGHNFWISGRGWIRTNQLQSGMAAHTATGTVRIDVEDAGRKADVFNLVVADLHTYFVGKSAVLCHDVISPAPTDFIVPGLLPELAEAK